MEYWASDIGRLQMIVSLKALGLSLREVREQLQRSDGSLIEVIEEQVRRLRGRIETTRALCERLEWMAGRMRSNETVTAQDFVQTMEMMTMFDKYYTPEQLRELEERAKVVGKVRISEVESEWPRLIEEVGDVAAMDTGPMRKMGEYIGRALESGGS